MTTRTGPRAYTRTTATWRGDSFVVAGVLWFYPSGDAPRKFTDLWAEEVWSLDADGRLVSLLTDQSAGGEVTTTRFVYRRSQRNARRIWRGFRCGIEHCPDAASAGKNPAAEKPLPHPLGL